MSSFELQGLLLTALTVLLIGCEELEPSEESETGSPTVALADTDNASTEVELSIAQAIVATERDVIIDWSGLSSDLWGQPAERAAEAHLASLRLFPGHSPSQLEEALATSSLEQSDVAIEVTCHAEDHGCPLSAFAFEASHPIDVVSMFVEEPGTWLLTIRDPETNEAISYLSVIPREDSDNAYAALGDGSTRGTMESSLPADDRVRVPADGFAELDWSAVTHDVLGQPVRLYQLDTLELLRVPGLDPEATSLPLHELHALAAETWVADIEGRTSFSLPELREATTGEQGFPGFEDTEGAWIVAIWASSTASATPAFLTSLTPSEG
jgi:hypothetical protein